MARNVPDIGEAPQYLEVSVRYIDDSGDPRSVLYDKLDPALTDETIEAHVAAAAAATSAVIHQVSSTRVWNAVEDASLAVDGEQNSVYDNVVLRFKTPTKDATNVFLPAPIEGIMESDTDRVNTASALYIAFRDTAEAMLPNEYEPSTVRFTERREINDNKRPA